MARTRLLERDDASPPSLTFNQYIDSIPHSSPAHGPLARSRRKKLCKVFAGEVRLLIGATLDSPGPCLTSTAVPHHHFVNHNKRQTPRTFSTSRRRHQQDTCLPYTWRLEEALITKSSCLRPPDLHSIPSKRRPQILFKRLAIQSLLPFLETCFHIQPPPAQ